MEDRTATSVSIPNFLKPRVRRESTVEIRLFHPTRPFFTFVIFRASQLAARTIRRGCPSVLRRDCTTPLLLGGCGETRGGIWSCIYAAAKVLSARSTSRFSRENPFYRQVRGPGDRALYRKFAKILRRTTTIFEKFRTRDSPVDRFDRISLWRDEPGQNSSGRSEYIRPGAAARGTNVGGEERGDGGYNMGYRGGPTPRGEQGPSFYYPGSHDGSQPWPNLIFSRTSADSLARSHSRVTFSVNIRVRLTCTYPRPRLGRQGCVRSRLST